MQIRNDYGSFQNENYRKSHAHHITECIREEQTKKNAGGAGAMQAAFVQSKGVEFSKDGDTYQPGVSNSLAKKTSGKSGTNLVKGLWDALGEEGNENNKHVLAVFKENILAGIHGAADAVKNSFRHQITDRVRNVREKIKMNAGSALKRFGRNKDAFAALTGGQTSSRQDSYKTKGKERTGQVSSAKMEEDIPMKILVHSHLMDSYNRRGEYSQLNDNLTYQKPGKTSGRQKEEQMKG